MRKLIASAIFVIAMAGLGLAADVDRHASYSDPKSPTAPAQCKGFYGSDDNRTACADWCGKFRTDNQGAQCDCAEGKCPGDDNRPPA